MTKQVKFIIAMIVFLIYGAVVLYSSLPGNIRKAEEKLQYSAQTQLGRVDANNKVKVELNGQVATLTGTTNSDAHRSDLIKSVKSSRWPGGLVAGGVTVVRADNLTVIAPPPKPLAPFRWTAEKTKQGVTLTGMVPDDTTRIELLEYANAQFPEGVTDRMSVARGAPSGDWSDAARTSLNTLSRLTTGRVTGNGSQFVISGRAASREIVDRAKERFSKLPEGFEGETIIVSPDAQRVQSPYDWNAVMGPSGTPLTLTGYVPTRKIGDKIVAYARKAMPGRRVIDRQVVANGVPTGAWEETVLANIDALARLKSGNVRARDFSFVLTGIADDDGLVSSVSEKINGLEDTSFSKTINIDVIAPPVLEAVDECQTLFDDAMRDNTINFQTGKANILPDSKALLERLGVAAKRCKGFQIEIAGHTDSSGAAKMNQDLSEARARSVVNYLTTDGVDGQQLSARGYGETKPIADNSSNAGKAKNRRIEFTIKTKKGS